MADATFEEQLVTALTATNSPMQLDGVEFDSRLHSIFGDVPMAVRHLHNLGKSLCLEYTKAHAFFSKNVEESEDVAAINYKMLCRTLQNQIKATTELKWSILHTHHPSISTGFKTIIILENWKMAGVKQLPTS